MHGVVRGSQLRKRWTQPRINRRQTPFFLKRRTSSVLCINRCTQPSSYFWS
ncbi:hypothetical protein BRADI_4g33482v3 [Brachypodium distachyon]|uniref:Uncharacterized protein n=1 Tax=Brachypodium distachyon TaxID=15368 RepID=A0A2K2CS08_BRADI|nr:hypothetical protein BRADI_4g33482v3 [Brachypodium distachyon]